MKIPSKIRIGGVDYTIEWEANVRDGTELLYGQIDYGNCVITLSTTDGCNPQHQGITLWHEILHGIAEHACLDLPQEDEEKIIDTLAKGIYQVLQDNGATLFDLAVRDSETYPEYCEQHGDEAIPRNIRAYRIKAGLTQSELGKRMGVTGSMIAQYESTKAWARKPKPSTLKKIAGALNIPVKELIHS